MRDPCASQTLTQLRIESDGPVSHSGIHESFRLEVEFLDLSQENGGRMPARSRKTFDTKFQGDVLEGERASDLRNST